MRPVQPIRLPRAVGQPISLTMHVAGPHERFPPGGDFSIPGPEAADSDRRPADQTVESPFLPDIIKASEGTLERPGVTLASQLG